MTDPQTLVAQREALETQLREIDAALRRHGAGLEDPLVDADGFPRSDIDVIAVRALRVKSIELRNDLKQTMARVEQYLHTCHRGDSAEAPPPPESDSPMNLVQTTQEMSTSPIVVVGHVSANSPAASAGLRKGDRIVKIGSVDHSNYTGLQQISSLVSESLQRSIHLRVQRFRQGNKNDPAAYQTLEGSLIPRSWEGSGFLGLPSAVLNKPPVKTENVQVTVRVRPPNAQERGGAGLLDTWDIDTQSNRISLTAEFIERVRKPPAEFYYDKVVDGSDNHQVYAHSVQSVVRSAMEGYNGTVFAYGQTASGKTYTMTGTPSQPGVIVQAIHEVFRYIRESAEHREYLLRISYLEIYNEAIRDLLSPHTTDLRIHDDRKRGVYVSPLKEEVVTTPTQVFQILKSGEANRHIGETDFNSHSSRSHTIFQLVVESRERNGSGVGTPVRLRSNSNPMRYAGVRVSQLNLIDLAGSEKATGNAERRKEGAFINKSLLTLGTVIAKLTSDKAGHIPFRDSKLTRILQSSLSGHARVSVIATVSPASANYEESINTLKFAARVKRVMVRAETHQVMDDKALLQKYRLEILDLKSKLQQVNQNIGRENELIIWRREKQKYQEELMELQLSRTALKERIDHLTKLILTSSSVAGRAIMGLSPRRDTPSSSRASPVMQVNSAADERSQCLQAKVDQQRGELSVLHQRIAELEAESHRVTNVPSQVVTLYKGNTTPLVRGENPTYNQPLTPTSPAHLATDHHTAPETLPPRESQTDTLNTLQRQLEEANATITQLRGEITQLHAQLTESGQLSKPSSIDTELTKDTPVQKVGRYQWPPESSPSPKSPTATRQSGRVRSPVSFFYPMGRSSPLYQPLSTVNPVLQNHSVSDARIKDLQQQLINERHLHKNNVSQYRQKVSVLEGEIALYKFEIDALKRRQHNV
ncbi:Kinesin-like protein kip2 [Dispira parvispora]|uniref:Kinesin-like protein n=1 Tax=Dispira parvispora TaxID=1520584 RepID=A0A9W8E659_9FUNG|nr:Kinesin-like protein kip2 [Dispira parvispora]